VAILYNIIYYIHNKLIDFRKQNELCMWTTLMQPLYWSKMKLRDPPGVIYNGITFIVIGPVVSKISVFKHTNSSAF